MLGRFVPRVLADTVRLPRIIPWFSSAFICVLGNGMAIVAIPWLAIEEAGSTNKGLAVAAASIAAFLFGIPVSLVVGALRIATSGRVLLMLDSIVRGVIYSAIALLAIGHHLPLGLYIGLLAISSVFRSLAPAGRTTLMADLVPPDLRLSANAVYMSQLQLGNSVVGPAIGGLVTATLGAAPALLIDGMTFFPVAIVLATMRGIGDRPGVAPITGEDRPRRNLLITYPSLAVLLVVNIALNFLYAPLEVALPVRVHEQFTASSALLGQLWTALGLGALVGSLLAGSVRRFDLKALMVAAVCIWGVSVCVLGLTQSREVALIALLMGGLAFGPYSAILPTLVQREAARADLLAITALWTGATTAAYPLGLLAGGAITAAQGSASTLLESGAVTIGLAILGGLLARAIDLHMASAAPRIPAALQEDEVPSQAEGSP